MKEVATEFYWHYPWTNFTYGNFNKYPNEFATHVVSVDVIDRNITKDGLLVTDRILQLKQPIPSILRKIGLPFPETTYFLERSILNPQTKHYEATTHNLSMRSFFQAIEICSIKADPEQGGTKFQQKAQFTACTYFNRLVEDAAVSRFESNAEQGREAMKLVLEKLHLEVDWFAREFDHQMAQVKKGISRLEHRLEDFEHGVKTHMHTLNSVGVSAAFQSHTDTIDEGCSGKWHSHLHSNPFC
ncbi:hypothetical protein HDV03_004963 [Kappamyces sp. JEL0829]|nr:hypothetical protein HDV03_004963 [Kappamyces sp. JEL0829]KAJ3346424.1 hypothetical protein HDU91_007043 [Kappamyces sp. JEL0680]